VRFLSSDGRWNCIRHHCLERLWDTKVFFCPSAEVQHVFRLRLYVSSWSGSVLQDDFYLSCAFAVTLDTQTNITAENFFCSCVVHVRFIKIPVC
jgi:hypothetical protein